MMSKNEKEFVEWLSSLPYKHFESDGSVHLYHYVFEYADHWFHISFSDRDTVMCGLVLDEKTGRERVLYKGFSWDYCLATINKLVEAQA